MGSNPTKQVSISIQSKGPWHNLNLKKQETEKLKNMKPFQQFKTETSGGKSIRHKSNPRFKHQFPIPKLAKESRKDRKKELELLYQSSKVNEDDAFIKN